MISFPAKLTCAVAPTWAAGIGLFCLSIGGQGAFTPFEPSMPSRGKSPAEPEVIMVEEFNPPVALAPAMPESLPALEPEVASDALEILEVPLIAAPLAVPEMAEITPLETYVAPKEAKPLASKPPLPRPPKPAATPQPQRDSAGSAATGMAASASGTGTSTRQLVRSPKPLYPSSLQRAGVHGSVRLLVTVETDGYASSVSVASSSGHPALDQAARDAVQRRWRWSSGSAMKTYVPIKFALQ